MATPAIQFWTSASGIPRAGWRRAIEAERQGYDGIVFVDSQNLAGDPYVAMAIAAVQTERILLGTGVTNPFTRHPAVAASAIASIQAESNGRAVLGIGRGDSALAHLGFSPASVGAFSDYLRRLQGYLRGEDVPLDHEGDVDRLGLADRPRTSRLEWLRPQQQKVPVDVAATGPRVIRASAVLADRVTFAVGADPDRLRWAIGEAREARRGAGLDIEGEPFGAYVTVVVHDDPVVAQHLGEGGVSLFARFSAMHGAVVGPATAGDRMVLERVHGAYDMRQHSQAGSPQAAVIDHDFALRFAILGPVDACRKRIGDLIDVGIQRFVVVGPSAGADRTEAGTAARRFVEEVMPTFR